MPDTPTPTPNPDANADTVSSAGNPTATGNDTHTSSATSPAQAVLTQLFAAHGMPGDDYNGWLLLNRSCEPNCANGSVCRHFRCN